MTKTAPKKQLREFEMVGLKGQLGFVLSLKILLMAGFLSLTTGCPNSSQQSSNQSQEALAFKFTIAHTNDLHSQFLGQGPDSLYTAEPDNDPVIGGYPRLATLIKKQRKRRIDVNEDFLLLDAGDFFAGSLFHSIGVSSKSDRVPEFEFFNSLGYDAITLGNHEFDAGEAGLERMMAKAKAQGFSLPFVLSNDASPKEQKHMQDVKEIIVKKVEQRNKEFVICIVGAMGPDASFASAITRSGSEFVGFNEEQGKQDIDALSEHLKNRLNKAKDAYGCQFNVLLTHAGNPEDTQFAESIPSLNLVISSHTHQKYFKKVEQKSHTTYISQAGFHGSHLGVLDFGVTESGQILLLNSEEAKQHIAVDDSIESDSESLTAIQDYKKEITTVLGKQAPEFDAPLTVVKKSIPLNLSYPNNELGGLLLENLRSEANTCFFGSSQAENEQSIDVYFSVMSLIRSEFDSKGQDEVTYQHSDIFKFHSIGFTPDFEVGLPVQHFYLSKEGFKLLLEFFEMYRFISPLATPAFSKNLQYKTRWWGVPLWSRISEIVLDGKSFESWPDKIHLATNSMIVGYLKQIDKLSRGLIDLKPLSHTGEPSVAEDLPCKAKEHELLIEHYKNNSNLN